jgi:hypothetical protein
MAYSLSAPASAADAHHGPTAKPRSAAPSVEATSTEVLITEQEVLFGTAAAARAQQRNVSHSKRASRPRRGDRPKRYEFLERALMARDGQTVNAVVAAGTAALLVVTAAGLYDLQSRLERWDYQRHFEE